MIAAPTGVAEDSFHHTNATATPTNIPGLGTHVREEVGNTLQAALVELIDLSLIGKQLHWNIVGPRFRSLHLELDELVDYGASQDVLTDVVRELERQLWMIRAQGAHP